MATDFKDIYSFLGGGFRSRLNRSRRCLYRSSAIGAKMTA